MIQFLESLSKQGIEFWTDNDQIHYRGSSQVVTPSLLNEIKRNKNEILQVLKEGHYVSKVYPLSYPQQSLWYIFQSAPESPAYNTAMTIRVHFNVNIDMLQSAMQALIIRHSCLRTIFSLEDPDARKPIQKVYAYQEVFFEHIDASTWSMEELREKVRDAHQRPFDLEKGPAFRASLFTRSEDDHVLLISIHHIVCDGWSMWTLMDELWKIYTAPEQLESGLVKLTHTYEDFVYWQAEMLKSAEGEQQWSYWQKQLSGELPVLDLATDYLRPFRQTYQGNWIPFQFDNKLSEQLMQFAKRKGVTLYALLLSAYQMLLHRYSNQDDILVGCPTSGRSREIFDGIVGHFVNPIVVRANFTGDLTVDECIDQISYTLLNALDNQDYPFALLVDRLNPIRDASRPPVFQTMFVFQKPHSYDRELLGVMTDFYAGTAMINLGDLKFESFPISQQEGQFDLSIEITGSEESLKGVLKYNKDLFSEDSMRRMVNHYVNLLRIIVENPEQRVSAINFIDTDESRKILVEWNNTEKNREIVCVHKLFEEQVSRSPEAIAVMFDEKQLRYRELNEMANCFARYLIKQGIKHGDLIGICVKRSFEMIIGIMGILKAGGTYVPLDPEYPQERLFTILEGSKISLLVASSTLADLFQPTDVRIIKIDENRNMIEQEDSSNLCQDLTAETLAYILHTSGSTGKPKGVAMPHRPLYNLIQWQKNNSIVAENAITMQFTTLSFDVSFQEIFATLCSGGALLLIREESRLDPLALLQLIQSKCVARIFVPYVVLQMLADAVEANDELLPRNLREVMTAGEQLKITQSIANMFKKLDHCMLHNQYGPTETHVVTSYTLKGKPDSWPLLPPIGRPVDNTQVYILDQNLQPVAMGLPGEIYIGGICLAQGYHGSTELTEERFIANPFSKNGERLYRTGDLGRYLPDGNIEFLGRLDRQVKIRGFRIEPAEIESHLLQHRDIIDVAVLAKKDHNGINTLCAYIVSDNDLPVYDLKQYLSNKIPNYMIPTFFIRVPKIPLLPNKKVDQLSLPQPDQYLQMTVAYIAPRDEVEETLSEICQEVLNRNKIGIDENLFDIGVNSLLTLTIQRKIDEVFPGKIKIPDLLKYPTIANLATEIRDREATETKGSGKEEQLAIFLAGLS